MPAAAGNAASGGRGAAALVLPAHLTLGIMELVLVVTISDLRRLLAGTRP